MRKLSTAISIFAAVLLGNTSAFSTPASTLFAQAWNRGTNAKEPAFQVQRIDDRTYAIRQSIRKTFEAPFLYLLFGNDKALLIDTGVEGSDLRAVIDRLISQREAQTDGQIIELVVMHTHGHSDHVGGDGSFKARPDTTIVGHAPAQVAAFFAIDQWPMGSAEFDLGNRVVEVLPTPGHHDAHVMVYDRHSKILFSGDALYPGRLYFKCDNLNLYRNSIARLRDWVADRPLDWVLGAHIEMKPEAGKSFVGQSKSRSEEHLLELMPSIVDQLHRALIAQGEQPKVQAHEQFVLFPHPADPRGKSPPDWCLQQP